MTKQERKKIAKQFANYEIILKNTTDKEEILKIQSKIEDLFSSVQMDLNDMVFIDEEVQKILEKNS